MLGANFGGLGGFYKPENMFDQKKQTSLITSSQNSNLANSREAEVNNGLQCHALHVKSNLQKFFWTNVVACLRKDPKLRKKFKKYLNVLSVSKEILIKFKHIPPVIQHFIDIYGSQNCLKAISVLEDLSSVRKNQYKFMFEGFSLGKSIDLLIAESTFLFKSLSKTDVSRKNFFRLVRNWVDYLFFIHNVRKDAQAELKIQILIRISIVNGISDGPDADLHEMAEDSS